MLWVPGIARRRRFLVGLLLASQQLLAQGPGQIALPVPQAPSIRPDYVLGPDDQILIRVPQEDQLNERPFRVDAEGFIDLPVAGRVKAAGLNVTGLEAVIADRLREFIVNPTVSITVVQFRSEPVFLIGAFRAPGIYPLQGRGTLVETLSAAGGVLPNASRRLRITRRLEYGVIPLPNAIQDTEAGNSQVEVSIQSLAENRNAIGEFALQAYDVISVDRAERVYISGDVLRPGPVELGERDSISVTQVIAESGGFSPFARRDKVRVLRPVLGTSRRAEIEIDMKRILEGKDIDYPLLPNDVLHVPKNDGKAFLVPTLTGMVASIPFMIISLTTR